MQVLREQRDSVMAMLEAFVHDPLVNWGLDTNKQRSSQESKADGGRNFSGASEKSEKKEKPPRLASVHSGLSQLVEIDEEDQECSKSAAGNPELEGEAAEAAMDKLRMQGGINTRAEAQAELEKGNVEAALSMSVSG